ncbi:MAG TPA: hypothetical protein VFK02_29840 [Kofleriaceae bacterium]|nr:hypothetical protein [Kofleriaceae bacterium]
MICYLDIAARDGVPMARIEAALDKIATQISATTPSATLAGEIAVEFRVTMLRAHEQAPILFDTLRATIRQLLNEPRDVPGRAQVTPLRIRVEKDDRCWRFSLDPSDRDRVRTEAATLTVPHDVADDLSMLYGDLFSHVAEWLTGLSREQILELGGVRFEGSINRTWPE